MKLCHNDILNLNGIKLYIFNDCGRGIKAYGIWRHTSLYPIPYTFFVNEICGFIPLLG